MIWFLALNHLFIGVISFVIGREEGGDGGEMGGDCNTIAANWWGCFLMN